MSKIIAVQSPGTRLSALLEERGYRVIDLSSANRSRTRVDAILYTGYRPDSVTDAVEIADISWGGFSPAPDEFPSAITLNITGLRPEQAVEALESRLRHRHWRF